MCVCVYTEQMWQFYNTNPGPPSTETEYLIEKWEFSLSREINLSHQALFALVFNFRCKNQWFFFTDGTNYANLIL